MILILLVIVPIVGGLLAWLAARANTLYARWISLATMLIHLILALSLWLPDLGQGVLARGSPWQAEINLPWIPSFGIAFHLGIDGLSLVLVLLTSILGMAAIGSSWKEIDNRVGLYHFNLLLVLAGITGVFLSLDLFLFYFFWELMLVPMYLIIAIWGHERRMYAAVKFFLFTQLSGLLMLVGILGLYFIHGQNTGTYTFDYNQLIGTQMSPVTATWLMLGFLAAFAVKLPVVPVHTWLPDAHTEAPTAGSIILAGLLLKNGAYGLLRFLLPLFPEAARAFAPLGMILGVVGILYGALLAFGQTDLKRLVAYTSVSHMGFVFLGVFAWNTYALQGTVMQMICHGISTGALFALVGALQERIHTRDLRQMGGLWPVIPRLGGITLVFAMASLGLPGLGNFVAEFLILLGAFQANAWLASLATLGLVSATVYALWMMQRAFFGPTRQKWQIPDLDFRELAIMAVLIVLIVWLGLFPQPVLNTTRTAIDRLQPAIAAQLSDPPAITCQACLSTGPTWNTYGLAAPPGESFIPGEGRE